MAYFSKPVTNKAGVVSTYWTISHAQADFTNSVVSATINGYLSEETFNNKCTPSATRPVFVTVPFSSLPNLANNGTISLPDLYNAINALFSAPNCQSVLAGATLVS